MATQWWKNAVVYQIYPRSFQDSNGDGIGDLQGIVQRLDYLRELGVDVIWLSPIYASPMIDNGYDISDYRGFNPIFGTMDDFDDLLAQIHQRGMRLIMDLVVNHTSNEHPWFVQSRCSKDNAFRDYYVWREGHDGREPNNWGSWFGGSAWEYNAATKDYYLHIFAKEQPDLNWNNAEVRCQIYDMMSWWLNKGVDGFRMDVISLISKPDELPDSPNGDLSPFCINGPHVHDYLQEMNKTVLSRYDIMTVGECPGMTIEDAKKYAGFDRRELNMVFHFEHTGLSDGKLGKWTDKKTYLPDLKKVFEKWQIEMKDKAWNCLFWGNHDQPRAVSKFGCDMPEYRDLSAKMLCACLYLMQGTPYIYQGEELGMTNPGYFSLEEYRDIESINAYHNFVYTDTLDKRTMLEYLSCVSRDNARTPMQWTNGPGAGFTSARPWIGLGRNWRAVNAERELADPNSVFHFYKKILDFRKNSPVVQDGDFKLLWPDNEQIFAYIRELKGERLSVYCNFSNQNILVPAAIKMETDRLVFGNYADAAQKATTLSPYEVRVYISCIHRRRSF